jgi:predicted nuclease of predicted toxin-antitoxin system
LGGEQGKPAMKFLVDAQLPRRLVYRLRKAGHDALHTLDLPNGNRTSDADINALSMQESRTVVTKDADFVSSFIVSRVPYKLLVISTGNISNADLEALLLAQLPALEIALASNDYLELTRSTLIIHI